LFTGIAGRTSFVQTCIAETFCDRLDNKIYMMEKTQALKLSAPISKHQTTDAVQHVFSAVQMELDSDHHIIIGNRLTVCKKEMDIQSDNRNLRSSEQQCVLIGKPIEPGRNKYSKNSRPTPNLLLGMFTFLLGLCIRFEKRIDKTLTENAYMRHKRPWSSK
jgi:hypothetical protein